MAGCQSKTIAVERIQYSFVPNHRETMQALARARFSNHEFRVVIALLNQTNGYLRQEDELSSAFWQALTFMSRQSVHATLNRLGSLGVIAENEHIYKVNHPNAWSPEVFKPQRIAQRSISIANSLLSKEKLQHDYRWLANLLKASPTRDDLKLPKEGSEPEPSLTSDAVKTVPGQRRTPSLVGDDLKLPKEGSEPEPSLTSDAVKTVPGQRRTVSKQRRSPSLTSDDLKLPKESSTKESSKDIGDYIPATLRSRGSATSKGIKLFQTEESSPKPFPRIKPKQVETGIFLDMVEQQIDTKLVNRAKLQGLIRPLLVKFPDATPERLMECFRWLKENDPYCRTRDSPMVVSLLPSKYPEWAAGKLPTPGGKEERYGKHGEHEPGIRGDPRQGRLRPITRISGVQED